MKILDTATNLDVDTWLRGLFGAGISGGSSAITGGLVVSGMNPSQYNFQAGKFWVLVGTLFMVNAIVSMAKFLQTEPIPEMKTVTTTTAVTESAQKPPVVVTTIAETHVEPVKKEN